ALPLASSLAHVSPNDDATLVLLALEVLQRLFDVSREAGVTKQSDDVLLEVGLSRSALHKAALLGGQTLKKLAQWASTPEQQQRVSALASVFFAEDGAVLATVSDKCGKIVGLAKAACDKALN
ncbi:MAG: hypothetical protein MHM6MM_008947, partial [Cercozoa sp. M6MM]